MIDRKIPFEGIENFRDFGGYAAGSGGRMRTGRLFRSAHHAEATDHDLARLAQMDLAVVIDLRKQEERESQPNRRWPDFGAQVIENNIGSVLSEWSSTVRDAGDVTAESWERHLSDWYRRAPYDERHIDLFRRYFRALAETDGAIVVHCAAGKDRTGLICALTHHLAGIHGDDIASDYLLSNDERRVTRRIDALTRQFQDGMGFTPSEETLRSIASVTPDYLQAAFQAVRDTHGGIDRYLSQALGVDDALRGEILARLIA